MIVEVEIGAADARRRDADTNAIAARSRDILDLDSARMAANGLHGGLCCPEVAVMARGYQTRAPHRVGATAGWLASAMPRQS